MPMEGSSEIEELSRIAESKLSIRSRSSREHIYGSAANQDAGSSSSLVNVLEALDRLDLRLKKLEDRDRITPAAVGEPHNSATCVPNSYQSLKVATINLEKRCRSLASALEEVQFKGTLMDRVKLLENRICQLSYEVDNGARTSFAPMKPSDEIEWLRDATTCRKRDPSPSSTSDHGGATGNELEGCIQSSEESQFPGKDQTAVGKQKSDRKKTYRNWPYRRWFSFGC